MTDKSQPVSPLRQRMLEDMQLRKVGLSTQRNYIRAVRRLAQFLRRSPDRATAEDLRRFQLDLIEQADGEARKNLERLFDFVRDVTRVYLPYILEEQLFDDPETRAILQGSGIECPSPDTYFKRLVRYGMERQFGLGG